MYSKEAYGKIRAWFLTKDYRFNLLKFVYKILPIFVFIGYPLLLVYLIVIGSGKLLQCITVPLGVFVSVTVLRKFINAARPYERLDIQPLMAKDTKGLSFPSRHTASSTVIAMTFLFVNVPLGVVFLMIAFLIGLSRIFAGVHFPRDVLAGFLYSVIMSALFFFVL